MRRIIYIFYISCIVFACAQSDDAAAAKSVIASYCHRRFSHVDSTSCQQQMDRWCKRRLSTSANKICQAIEILKILNPKRTGSKRPKKADKTKIKRLKDLMNTKIQRRQSLLQMDASRTRKVPKKKPQNARKQHTELSVNDVDAFIQGDIELSENQAQILEADLLSDPRRNKRKIGRQPLYKLWPSFPISYQIAANIPANTQRKIKQAIELWELNTCARFLLNGPDTNRIEFYDGGGCSSYVGKIGGTQEISISTPGCDYVGIIAHEIGHTLGSFHEQARPDQDEHISVNYDNIPLSRWNNFQAVEDREAEMYNLPYDTGSVMHYGPYGFATNPNVVTIETSDQFSQDTIGQRVKPSFLDFAAVNMAYSCGSKKCGNRRLLCQHGGYMNPNKCDSCLCPNGFSGSKCERVEPTNCGGEIQVYSTLNEISSPNYPSNFGSGSRCIWLLKTLRGHKISLEFTDQFEFQCEETCDKSYVELKRKSDFRLTGYRFCCSNRPSDRFLSESNEMVVIFDGKDMVSRGFKATFWSDVSEPGTTKAIETTTGTTMRKTTRPLPSTTKPIPLTNTTEAPDDPCQCGPWSDWSPECSQICGGCGSRSRSRQCRTDRECFSLEKRKCNFDSCPARTNVLINNGEFHFLWNGCCVGLVTRENKCGRLDNQNRGRGLVQLLSNVFQGAQNVAGSVQGG